MLVSAAARLCVMQGQSGLARNVSSRSHVCAVREAGTYIALALLGGILVHLGRLRNEAGTVRGGSGWQARDTPGRPCASIERPPAVRLTWRQSGHLMLPRVF